MRHLPNFKLGTCAVWLALVTTSCGTPPAPVTPGSAGKSLGVQEGECEDTTEISTKSAKTTSNKSTTSKSTSSSTSSSGKTQLKLADANVGYKDTVKAILDKNCISCHGANATPPNLSTYAAASDAADSSLRAIQAGTMPTSKKLADADTQKFSAWVAAGSPETASGTASGSTATKGKSVSGADTDSPTCETTEKKTTKKTPTNTKAPSTSGNADPGITANPTTPPAALALTVTYDSSIASYLQTNCTSCHGNRTPKLETYAAAKANAQAMLRTMKLTGNGKMPPSSGATAAAIEKMDAWIKAGTPEK